VVGVKVVFPAVQMVEMVGLAVVEETVLLLLPVELVIALLHRRLQIRTLFKGTVEAMV
jgi:hypothetical protein